jgi:hypothetical protein
MDHREPLLHHLCNHQTQLIGGLGILRGLRLAAAAFSYFASKHMTTLGGHRVKSATL